jgi:hypothetical protein
MIVQPVISRYTDSALPTLGALENKLTGKKHMVHKFNVTERQNQVQHHTTGQTRLCLQSHHFKNLSFLSNFSHSEEMKTLSHVVSGISLCG